MDRFSPYRGPNHELLSNLSKSPREIIATKKAAKSFEQPPRMFGSKRSRDMSKYCHFHEDHRHDTSDCRQLRNQIEEAVKSGQLSHLVKGIKKERVKASENQRPEGKKDKSTTPAEAPILIIRGIGTVFSTHESDKIKEGMKKVRKTPPVSEKRVFNCTMAEEKVVVNNKYPEQTVAIRKQLPEHFKGRLRDLLRANVDVFAWTHADMTGIPRTIMVKGKPFNT
ncbi:hypothetical protein Tco_0667345 [Tanacetum coccineum]